MIDKYRGIREHSIFVIIATLINVCNESNDIHEEAPNCISILKQATDKHAPIKKASQSKRRQLAKPWFTKGLLLVKHKQKFKKNHTSLMEILIRQKNISLILPH